MGLEGGPGAWWRTRMLPSPFTVLLLSVDKLEAAAGQPAVWQGAGDIPPARRCPNHFYTSSVPRRTRDSRRCFQPAKQLSEIQEAALLLSEPNLAKWSSYLPILLLSKPMLVALIVQTQFLFFLPRVLCGHRCSIWILPSPRAEVWVQLCTNGNISWNWEYLTTCQTQKTKTCLWGKSQLWCCEACFQEILKVVGIVEQDAS